MLPDLSRLGVASIGANNKKRDRDDTIVALTVSSAHRAPPELKLAFEIEEDSDDRSLSVTLVEPQDCNFSFSVSADHTTAHSGGYKCERGRGARVLPRLIVGAMHALEQKGHTFSTLNWTGEAVCNLENEWDHDEYKAADDKDANVAKQAKKIGWRLDYYARLGFDVDGSVNDVAGILRDALEENEEEDVPTLQDAYIQYDGDVVKLSQTWKSRFELRIDEE
mgnify:CR=1 FL=1|tara:strand:+ start:117 stop:782 length:666 start_codon:yes stop_codon:yes gene_type:complete